MPRCLGVVLAVLALAVSSAASALSVPLSDYESAPGSGDHQHGEATGHLPPSSHNVELVGKLDLTDVPGGIGDVSASGSYAYVNAFRPECTANGGSGAGVHVVDISDPTRPTKVGFLAAEPNSYLGEGVHVIHFEGKDILLHNNETCDGTVPVVSGFTVWDVTDPLSPAKLGQYGDDKPARSGQRYHATHSVQGFVWRDRAYAVAQDSQDRRDVDIFDITPAIQRRGDAVPIAEMGFRAWPGAHGSYANGDQVFHHDMQQKVVDGHNLLLLSYWDAGQILLNIDDPANPVFVTDSDYSSPDPEMPLFEIPEGNSHQSYWSSDGRYVVSADEDFSPFRLLFEVTTGRHAGHYGADEFGWTLPLERAGGDGFAGTTVFGGSGCDEDLNGNGVDDRAEVPSAAASGADAVVFSRGACFFSTKVETGQRRGYDAVIIGQSHAATRRGLLPDSFACGAKGHDFTPTVFAVCTGHRAMHLLFDDRPAYAAPEGYRRRGDLPRIGARGAAVRARVLYDGWGYAHLHDAATLAEIDTYAISEALDPALAKGFGHLSVHEVKTDPRPGVGLAYLSWYSAGLRVARFGEDGIEEVGHYIAPGGNDFWGVFPHLPRATDGDGTSTGGADGRPLILATDRDSGLWIFRYSGPE